MYCLVNLLIIFSNLLTSPGGAPPPPVKNQWFMTTVAYSLKCELGYAEPPHKSYMTE